jgi:hypothetical protein
VVRVVQVRLLRAGVDNAAGRPVAAAEFAGAKDVAVDCDQLEVRHPGRRYRCAAGANANELTSVTRPAGPTPRRGAANRSRTLARRAF